MVEFLLMNLIVGSTVFLAIKYLFNFQNVIDNILSVFMLFCGQVILTELILGIANRLYFINLILSNLIVLCVVLLAIKLRNADRQNNFAKRKDQVIDFSFFLNNKVLLFCISVIAGFFIVKILINLVNPPFGWDSLNYHFTFPVEWIKHGNLNMPITINDDPTPTYYPINNNLIYLWLIFPFKNVFLADIGQAPFFIMAFLACYSIARKLNLNREYSFIAASLFSITPNYFKQIEFGYADIMMAALFLISLNFLLLLNRDFRFRNLFFVSISSGIFLGTKTVCIPYSAILTVFLLYIFIGNVKSLGLKKISGCFLFFTTVFILFGGFGYIRNFILTGNPLYPLNARIFGYHIFKGVMHAVTYRAHWLREDFNLYKLFFREGMGVQFVLLFFPAMILSLPIMFIKNRRKAMDFNLFYVLLLPLLLYLTFRYLIPQLWTRFLYPFLGVSAIASVYMLSKLKVPNKAIKIITIVCFLGSIAELAGHAELGFCLLASLLIYLLLPIIVKVVSNKKLVLKLALIGIILFAITLKILAIDYDKNEFRRYVTNSPLWREETLAWRWLNENTDGNRIAYVGRPVPFPLYGTNFKNDVYYVSVNEKPPVLHAFKDGHLEWGYNYYNIHMKIREDGNYREKANFNIWHNNLLIEKTDYLFVYRLHQTDFTIFPIEDEWAKKHPRKFESAFLNEGVHIYKVLN